MMCEQLEFDFVVGEKPCRTCSHWWTHVGVKVESKGGGGVEKVDERRYFACGLGIFAMSWNMSKMPTKCNMWMLGGSKMPFVNFKKMSEEQLRAQLDQVRAGRRGVGRKKRVESKERRIASDRKERKPKEIIHL